MKTIALAMLATISACAYVEDDGTYDSVDRKRPPTVDAAVSSPDAYVPPPDAYVPPPDAYVPPRAPLALVVQVNRTYAMVCDTPTAGALMIKLSEQPTASLTATLTVGDPSMLATSPTSLTFTTSNWSTAQPVAYLGLGYGTDTGWTTVTVSAPGVAPFTTDVQLVSECDL